MLQMLYSAPVASIGLDEIIIGLIIFGSIVSKIMGARKADGEGAQRAPRPRSAPGRVPSAPSPKHITEAQSELEEFLNSLNAAAMQQEVEQAPTPPPPPPLPKPQQLRRPGPAPVQVSRPAPVRTPTRIRQKRVEPAVVRSPMISRKVKRAKCVDDRRHSYKEITVGGHAYCDGPQKKSEFVNAITDDLIDKKSIRKAIALREILGSPLALRNHASF